jgi:hypothetical protein
MLDRKSGAAAAFKWVRNATAAAGNFEYGFTQTALLMSTHTREVADEYSERERALRSLPLSYSLALRLRDAGVAPDVICEYVGVEEASLAGVLRMAEAKLASAQGLQATDCQQSAVIEY